MSVPLQIGATVGITVPGQPDIAGVIQAGVRAGAVTALEVLTASGPVLLTVGADGVGSWPIAPRDLLCVAAQVMGGRRVAWPVEALLRTLAAEVLLNGLVAHHIPHDDGSEMAP